VHLIVDSGLFPVDRVEQLVENFLVDPLVLFFEVTLDLTTMQVAFFVEVHQVKLVLDLMESLYEL
jgi:hypothetical protein